MNGLSRGIWLSQLNKPTLQDIIVIECVNDVTYCQSYVTHPIYRLFIFNGCLNSAILLRQKR